LSVTVNSTKLIEQFIGMRMDNERPAVAKTVFPNSKCMRLENVSKLNQEMNIMYHAASALQSVRRWFDSLYNIDCSL